MWRTVIVSKGEKITVKNSWMVVYGDNIESHVPIEDIIPLLLTPVPPISVSKRLLP